MNEFELISQLIRDLPQNKSVIIGAGDDCAVLDLGIPGTWILFKADAVVEGIHFLATTPPEKIGRKAIARCLSDVAAMAGEPTAALVTLALPKTFEAAFVKKLYEGLNEIAGKYEVAVVGGETTTNPERILISIALLGTVAKDKAILRKGAKSGDAIFVTGELGGSLAAKHLEFDPRLNEARWLAEKFSIHSMIDVSDGLASDLRHLLEAGNVGAELHASAIPISRAAKLQARAESSAKPPLLAALTDGEDFELLFTVASSDAVSLLDAWKIRFPGARLSCIGKITNKPGLQIRDERGLRPLSSYGYVHFA